MSKENSTSLVCSLDYKLKEQHKMINLCIQYGVVPKQCREIYFDCVELTAYEKDNLISVLDQYAAEWLISPTGLAYNRPDKGYHVVSIVVTRIVKEVFNKRVTRPDTHVNMCVAFEYQYV